jgi:co-chaperonin GroES (HSP10)
MKLIITESQYKTINEMIKLDIKVGDTIMGGKFKNKKVVVKTIGTNERGDITINGKPLLRFRIIKE